MQSVLDGRFLADATPTVLLSEHAIVIVGCESVASAQVPVAAILGRIKVSIARAVELRFAELADVSVVLMIISEP